MGVSKTVERILGAIESAQKVNELNLKELKDLVAEVRKPVRRGNPSQGTVYLVKALEQKVSDCDSNTISVDDYAKLIEDTKQFPGLPNVNGIGRVLLRKNIWFYPTKDGAGYNIVRSEGPPEDWPYKMPKEKKSAIVYEIPKEALQALESLPA